MELHPYLHKVQFYETDGMSIVHHGNHILWMEEARSDFLDQLGWGYEKAVEAGIDFAVYSVSCAYKSMTRYGETVAITVKVNKLQLTKLELGYRMVDSVTGQLRAEGTSVHFFYDRAKGRPVSLKKALPEVYTLLEAFVET
ncbi:acyl-CoA thioesterase [Pseudoflavonifractor phocaeensis]|uniref:acyl-CoA thioesterase n=1 Tax=Oscillospiraceae TaxID=216572 RepID=UPI001748AC0A|nr:thioesterase family protein [Flavonifractor sp. An306]MBM6722060.1 acyl-CoA thioesterase [Pseudoflavonifractor phocaeensis]MBM6886895.1 acyl-CoA thioesterase [Pseudoflavonifractor phocaeensis]